MNGRQRVLSTPFTGLDHDTLITNTSTSRTSTIPVFRKIKYHRCVLKSMLANLLVVSLSPNLC